ncbi:uncharacterized protein LOC117158590 [Bombus vancouverensis nearcticus]|uniref:uncharacterized protein LOC117158590 n=1 Tax=Bombus vancouverensis nearcticus TaxID=2705178 RepID=UPI00402BC67D
MVAAQPTAGFHRCHGYDKHYERCGRFTTNSRTRRYLVGPYWIKSYQETFSTFKHMGLWEYCFEQFRYPYYQFDKEFDRCRHIFSEEYYLIIVWLLPRWLMIVQTFFTLSLLL